MAAHIDTIGQTVLVFGDTEEDCLKKLNHDTPDKPIYEGKLADLPREIAAKVAKLHPGCIRYNEYAMGVLYEGRGGFRGGTECPVLAIQSFCLRKGGKFGHGWVIIWNPLEQEENEEYEHGNQPAIL